MTKKSRTILFFICLFFFLLISPLAVLYSQGYRINFAAENGEKFITKTGGIFIKAQPKQAEIYINGNLEEKTDFFAGSALVKNLLPKKYQIKVQKTGYLSWEKNLPVKEKQVTEAKSIILFPENFDFSLLQEGQINPFKKESPTTTIPKNVLAYQIAGNNVYYLNASGSIVKSDLLFSKNEELGSSSFPAQKNASYGLQLSPDGKKIAYFSDYEIWVLFLQAVTEQPAKKAGEKIFLARFSEKIGNISWINSDYLALSAGNKIKISEIDDRDNLNIYDIGEFVLPKIIFDSATNKIYISSQEEIYSSILLLN